MKMTNFDFLTQFLPDGAKLYMMPELPKTEFEKDGVTYKVTDLRLLNETGVYVVKDILEAMCNQPFITSASYEIKVDEKELRIITDIVCGFSFSAKKKGRNGFDYSGCLVSGSHWDDEELVFTIPVEIADSVYRCAHNTGGYVEITDLIAAICTDAIKRFDEVTRDGMA